MSDLKKRLKKKAKEIYRQMEDDTYRQHDMLFSALDRVTGKKKAKKKKKK